MIKFEAGKVYSHYINSKIQFNYACVKRGECFVTFRNVETGFTFRKIPRTSYGQEVVSGKIGSSISRVCLVAGQLGNV